MGSYERELSIIGGDRRGWKELVQGISASSAVMLTDTVPGRTVTQRDGLRHYCPISSSQELPCMHETFLRKRIKSKIEQKYTGGKNVTESCFLVSCKSLVFICCNAARWTHLLELGFLCNVARAGSQQINACQYTLRIVCWWMHSAGVHKKNDRRNSACFKCKCLSTSTVQFFCSLDQRNDGGVTFSVKWRPCTWLNWFLSS